MVTIHLFRNLNMLVIDFVMLSWADLFNSFVADVMSKRFLKLSYNK